jgi:2-alkenal reductase
MPRQSTGPPGTRFHVETASGLQCPGMRARSISVAAAAAALGAAAALAVAHSTGWLATTTNATYVINEQAPASPAAVGSPAGPLVGGFAPARIYAQRAPGVVTVFAFFGAAHAPSGSQSQGSGFVVSGDGVILTNSHVITNAGEVPAGVAVERAQAVYVEFADGDRVPARVVGWDLFDDVGVIQVDTRRHRVTPVPLGDSSRVVVGEPVAAIGSPFGNTDSLSVGVVSATRSIASLTSKYDVVDAIQTDASINHGNSGGPLFDARGRVIGINAQLRGNGNATGVGFAIPINAAKRSLAQLLARGRVDYAYAGISTNDLTPGIARRYGYPVLHGAVIESVEERSAAARAGLRAGQETGAFAGETVRLGGDVIVAIDGLPVAGSGDVVRIISGRLEPQQTATFTIYRGARKLAVRVRLARRPHG